GNQVCQGATARGDHDDACVRAEPRDDGGVEEGVFAHLGEGDRQRGGFRDPGRQRVVGVLLHRQLSTFAGVSSPGVTASSTRSFGKYTMFRSRLGSRGSWKNSPWRATYTRPASHRSSRATP